MIIQEIVDLDEFEDVIDEDEEIVAIMMISENIIVFATKRAMYAMIEENKESIMDLKNRWPDTFDWMEIPEDDEENGEE